MGQQASVPKPGAKLQVIGAGLPRTGTASFSKALEILLDGPVYHGGTQVLLGPEIEITSWIKVLSHWPPRNETDAALVHDLIASRSDGYVAITDVPTSLLVSELMTLYPSAKVICTTRDIESWAMSAESILKTSTMWFLRGVLFLLPSLRYAVSYVSLIRKVWTGLYGDKQIPDLYDQHIARLKAIVPENRLVFFDVKDGWEPLCKVLGKPVPEGIPFPRINDSKAIEEFSKKQVRRGLIRWAWILTAIVAVVVAIWMQRRMQLV